MDLSNHYLQILGIVLAVLMGVVELINWLNRRHGGFMRGWAGALFIGVCWAAALAMIVLRVRS